MIRGDQWGLGPDAPRIVAVLQLPITADRVAMIAANLADEFPSCQMLACEDPTVVVVGVPS